MKKVLITGASGFAGSFLTEYLVSLNNCEVIAVAHGVPDNLKNVSSKIKVVELNLLDVEKVEELIKNEKPDEIYHLAALAAPSVSFKNPAETITNNITAEINVLEAVRDANLIDTKILIISSADIYGIVNSSDLPINEETKLNPTNPYAVSKIAQDLLALQYFNSYKLKVIRVRPFNHIGPRQGLNFAVSDFAKRIVDIEKGLIEPILKVGNLDAKRDFADVRDMVKAYVLALEKCEIGDVYNIGTGISHKMSDIVEMLKKLSKKDFKIQFDESLARPSDNPELRCDNSKFVSKTSWIPEIPLEKSLEDILDYWRGK